MSTKKSLGVRFVRKVKKLFFSMGFLERRDLIPTYIIGTIAILALIATLIGRKMKANPDIDKKRSITVHLTGLSVFIVSLLSVALLFGIAVIEKNRAIKICRDTPMSPDCTDHIRKITDRYVHI